jgi:hypothetical protein
VLSGIAGEVREKERETAGTTPANSVE